MSTTNRPTSRWSSSTKSAVSLNQPTPIKTPPPPKKLYPPFVNQQHTFSHRMSKTRHDVEQLFKIYYSTNIKFETFQKQIVTGTRIPSAQNSSIIQNNFLNSSTNVFRSKHCVSREDESPSDVSEQPIINPEVKPMPIKRTVQVRIDNNPAILASATPSPDGIRLTSNSDSALLDNAPISSQQIEFNETSVACIDDISTDLTESSPLRKSRSAFNQNLLTSIITLPPIPSTNLSLINNRKDLLTLSHTSFSTHNSFQPTNQSNINSIPTTNNLMIRERSRTKSALLKHRNKSPTQQTNFKTSAVTIQYDQADFPMAFGTRVVSIPSKYSRYVLVTLPQTSSVRCNPPTYVERILLPERFPALYQNIIHNRNNK